jgi:hypothetical protein
VGKSLRPPESYSALDSGGRFGKTRRAGCPPCELTTYVVDNAVDGMDRKNQITEEM